MLLIRKLSRSIKKDPLLNWQSPLADECIIGRAAIRQCPRAYKCHRSVRSLFDVERDGFASKLIGSGVNRHCVASFSSFVETVLVQARDPAKLSSELVTAIDEGRHEDAWKLYELHMQMDGFPRKSVVHKLIVSLTETLDVQWLNKAYGLVERAFEESKQNLFEKETLIYLSFGLAKGGLPVAASTILRKLVDMEGYPPVAAWSAILAYMSQTAPGAYLAAELVLEIGYLFQDGRVDPRKKSNVPLVNMKPNTTAFNIALAGCLLFDTCRKAEELLDMMPRIQIKADTNLLIIMAHIHERNGR